MTVSKLNGDPIVNTTSPEIREMIKSALKEHGASRVLTPNDEADCVAMLEASKSAILILDWGVGATSINKILTETKEKTSLYTREILIVSSGQSQDPVFCGLEYGVTRVCSGDLSRAVLNDAIAELIEEHNRVTHSKDKMREVVELRAQGDWQGAAGILDTLNMENPHDDLIAFELAENMIHLGEWVDALGVVQPFAEGQNPSLRSIHLMGRCLLAKGDFDEAIGMLNKADLLNPNNVSRLIDLGNAYLAVNQFEDATTVFGRAVQLDKKNQKAKKGLSLGLLAAGDINEALPLIKSITSPREMASLFNSSAILSSRAGEYENSLALYRLGVTLVTKDQIVAARLIFNMGISYKKQNQFKKAYVCFSKANELDPKFKRCLQHKNHVEGILKSAGVDIAALDAESKNAALGESENVALGESENVALVDLKGFDINALPDADKTAEMAKSMEFSNSFGDEESDDLIDI